jgi:hypothetical protein
LPNHRFERVGVNIIGPSVGCEIDKSDHATNDTAISSVTPAVMAVKHKAVRLNYIQKLLKSAFEARHIQGK